MRQLRDADDGADVRVLPNGRAHTKVTFREGDLVLLVDGRDRRYLLTLKPGDAFHSHHGPLAHDDIVGRPEGVTVRTQMGHRMCALRPTLADYTLKMPRGATVIYPKDTGPILVHTDIHPGARVLEAGTGSGALTLALLRAVGPKGTVHTFEVREDFHAKALRNVERFTGSDSGYGTLDARLGDVYEAGVELPEVDRVVLDLTEPWRAVDNVGRALRSGGILCCYMPTVPQVQRLVDRISTPDWGLTRTFETLHRGWNVEGLSVRPDHRMVAHTAFLVVTRRMAPEA